MPQKHGFKLNYKNSFWISAILFVSLFYCLDWDVFLIIIEPLTFVFSVLLIYLLFFTNGLQLFYLTKKNSKTTIELKDIFCLPLSMHLFGYILPFRGSYLFSIFYLKKKYNISIQQGSALGLASLLISLFISGIMLVFISFFIANFLLFSLGIFITLSIFLPSIFCFFTKRRKFNHVYLKKILTFVNSVAKNASSVLKNKKQLFFLLILTLLNILIQSYWFKVICVNFHVDLSIPHFVLYAILLRLSIFIRLLPGNIGIQEVFSGLISKLIGIDFETGVSIGIFFRLSSIFISLIIGLPFLIYNKKLFQSISLSALLQKIKAFE